MSAHQCMYTNRSLVYHKPICTNQAVSGQHIQTFTESIQANVQKRVSNWVSIIVLQPGFTAIAVVGGTR